MAEEEERFVAEGLCLLVVFFLQCLLQLCLQTKRGLERNLLRQRNGSASCGVVSRRQRELVVHAVRGEVKNPRRRKDCNTAVLVLKTKEKTERPPHCGGGAVGNSHGRANDGYDGGKDG